MPSARVRPSHLPIASAQPSPDCAGEARRPEPLRAVAAARLRRLTSIMARTGFARLPLHGGKAPRYLFERMVMLSREIIIFIVGEFGHQEVLHRLSDPYWFQAFGCVLGFDWHSSGLTTTVCGAVKQGLKGTEKEIGLYVAGGKGAASRKTPAEITTTCDRIGRDAAPLVYASRISAKVDSAAVQDGY